MSLPQTLIKNVTRRRYTGEDGRLIIIDPEQPQPEENKDDTKMDDEDDEDDSIKPGKVVKQLPRRKLQKGKVKAGQPISKKASKLKKAGGDVRKKNAKYEPFSYIPLKAGQLNKRRRQTAHQAYKQVLTKPSIKGRGIRKK